MRILAMDTSNQTMTVAVVENGITVAEQTTNVKRNHSIQLMPAVQRVIQDAGMKIEEIDRVVVAKGPGSILYWSPNSGHGSQNTCLDKRNRTCRCV